MQHKWYVASGYGNGRKEDILLFTMDANGKMELKDALTHGECPSFLCTAGKKIFAAGECSDKAVITSFCVKNGKLVLEKRIEFPGRGLCHLAAGEQVLYAGCYQSGELYVVDQNLEYVACCYCDGIHIHGSTCVSEHELLVADLGRDVLLKFYLREGRPEGKPEQIALREGSGPRQILYDEKSHKIIVINENGNTVALGSRETWYQEPACYKAQAWHQEPAYYRATQTYGSVNYPGGACIDDSGKLFLANRGADTIAVFDIAQDMRMLGEWDCVGHWPRHLYCTEGGLVLAACEKSDELRSFIWKTDTPAGASLYPADTLPLVRAACVAEVKDGYAD